jgi:hypothetical protein
MPSGQGEIPLTASAEASAQPNSPDAQTDTQSRGPWVVVLPSEVGRPVFTFEPLGKRFLRAITRVSETAMNTSKSDTNSTGLGAPELPIITISRSKVGGRSMSPRPAVIPAGSWPRRMCAELAAGYCGEPTVEAFIVRVGRDYPEPRVAEGRRRLWLRDDLDKAILPRDLAGDRDTAEDL